MPREESPGLLAKAEELRDVLVEQANELGQEEAETEAVLEAEVADTEPDPSPISISTAQTDSTESGPTAASSGRTRP